MVSTAQLQEVRFEFSERTVYCKMDAQNLDLHLCGHGMATDDVQDALRVVAWLNEHGDAAERPATCAGCSACNLGCFRAAREELLENQLDQLMRAVSEVTNTSGNKVEVTFMHTGKQYIFSAEWKYLPRSMGIPGDYYLNNLWTYFVQNPSEQLLVAIQNVPGVLEVKTEVLKGTATQAYDIFISSRHTSLETCLVAVTNVLAS